MSLYCVISTLDTDGPLLVMHDLSMDSFSVHINCPMNSDLKHLFHTLYMSVKGLLAGKVCQKTGNETQ